MAVTSGPFGRTGSEHPLNLDLAPGRVRRRRGKSQALLRSPVFWYHCSPKRLERPFARLVGHQPAPLVDAVAGRTGFPTSAPGGQQSVMSAIVTTETVVRVERIRQQRRWQPAPPNLRPWWGASARLVQAIVDHRANRFAFQLREVRSSRATRVRQNSAPLNQHRLYADLRAHERKRSDRSPLRT